MIPDPNYTANDHQLRDQDYYALAKYEWTIRKMRQLNLNSSSRVANIGCGAGSFNDQLSVAGYRVFSSEPDSEAYANAVARQTPNCEIKNASLFEIKNQKFDAIIMHDVLEHIDEEGAALAQITSLLDDAGLLFLTVPALDRLFGNHDLKLGHFRRYDRPAIRRLLRENFKILELRYFGFSFIPITWFYSKFSNKEYPEIASSGAGFFARIFSFVCRLEGRFPLPLGTSVMVVARRI